VPSAAMQAGRYMSFTEQY